MIEIEDDPIPRINILSIGESDVGKSCVIKRYCEGRFVKEYIATIGVDYGVKPTMINDISDFWDTAGDDLYFQIRNEFYQNYHGILFVYDATRPATFDSLNRWVLELKQFTPTDGKDRKIPGVVLANKIDKGQKYDKIKVLDWVESHGYKYFETSALTGENLNEVFSFLFSAAYEYKTK